MIASARLRPIGAALLWAAAATGAHALGNPASAYCESRGGKVEMAAGSNGGQRGICVLPGGSRVDEWVLFRNAHRTTRH